MANRNHFSTNPTCPSAPSLPDKQVSSIPGSNVGTPFKFGTFLHNTYGKFHSPKITATIIGAEFDSSDRDPPPRCHPGTRLAIIQRCLNFILMCSDHEKLRWVFGPAGVGKSAIMQIIAEKAPDGVIFASVFFSVNGRRDGTKTIATIAYQLAVKYRFLVIIDGLDECDNPFVQRELLQLITALCLTNPASPILWIVASRPEPHITSFFEKTEVQPVYVKEEIAIDSDQAGEDVQRYLRAGLKKIQLEYPTLKRKRDWPSELEFIHIATAASGLFAYASVVVRYIGDAHYGDPAARLRYVLEVIDDVGKDETLRKDHPMAQLDALYSRILSNIPDAVMMNTRKLLRLHENYVWRSQNFRLTCNAVGLTEDAAYGAVRHLHAVAKIPDPDRAHIEPFEHFHKSFPDFLLDCERSKFFDDNEDEVQQFVTQTLSRIVEEVPDDLDEAISDEGIGRHGGFLKAGLESCRKVSLSWPANEYLQHPSNDELRLNLYETTMTAICRTFSSDSCFYSTMPWFHALTTRFKVLPMHFPHFELSEAAFANLRPELTELGRIKQVPLRALDCDAICGYIELQFRSPMGVGVKLSSPWNPFCDHGKQESDGPQQCEGWTTYFGRVHDEFGRYNKYDEANVEFPRLEPVVQFSFTDPNDGVSEWRYRLFHSGSPTGCYE
ncbi:hypothetical protein AGABI1DRAFT_95166 [Agaricus bisporus var. burnettii JB137-S8]|uniref:NACHT domain-containing protein n=1 Tax=Agaricus bisporus var. burnettii (strain JB137-S8 / ATCC MYA-4627 / FGSC 10392) TaxID=597362 RepID=K5WWV3_AGABU|nr:uncharacterized protein AGABI1DRAFT_95166 [Agaricus bisporus var. burnettii JB137-S8]EKM75057.1 hypothetical protein AGABI1DRAFT_95166 [Agaricus bisporus var. burnettii JB137-S8]